MCVHVCVCTYITDVSVLVIVEGACWGLMHTEAPETVHIGPNGFISCLYINTNATETFSQFSEVFWNHRDDVAALNKPMCLILFV